MALISYIKRFDTLPALLAKRGYLSHQSGKWWEGSYKQGDFTHGMTRGFPNPGCRGGDDGWKIGREGMKPVDVPIRLSVAELPRKANGVRHYIGTCHDLTTEKLKEEQLRRSQKMDALGKLTGGIAHDFNNILMGMQGNASLMLLTLDSHHPHYAKVKAIERYVESGAALTRQLLGFARGGKYEVKITKLDELVRRTARMFGRTKKEIRIHTDGLVGVRSVEVDQSQIEQVLLNILVNAWHAMPGTGS